MPQWRYVRCLMRNIMNLDRVLVESAFIKVDVWTENFQSAIGSVSFIISMCLLITESPAHLQVWIYTYESSALHSSVHTYVVVTRETCKGRHSPNSTLTAHICMYRSRLVARLRRHQEKSTWVRHGRSFQRNRACVLQLEFNYDRPAWRNYVMADQGNQSKL
jgi:hypothetical protein